MHLYNLSINTVLKKVQWQCATPNTILKPPVSVLIKSKDKIQITHS